MDSVQKRASVDLQTTREMLEELRGKPANEQAEGLSAIVDILTGRNIESGLLHAPGATEILNEVNEQLGHLNTTELNDKTRSMVEETRGYMTDILNRIKTNEANPHQIKGFADR